MMTETVVTVENAPNNNAAKSGDGNALGWIKFNVEYFKTLPGIVKIIQLIIGILCMSLASAQISGTHWFIFVATISFISTIIWSFVYLLGVREALNIPIDWLLSETVNTGIKTVMYFTAFIVQIVVWAGPNIPYFWPRGANLAAGVFGILNTIAYGYGTMLLYKEYKSSRTTN